MRAVVFMALLLVLASVAGCSRGNPGLSADEQAGREGRIRVLLATGTEGLRAGEHGVLQEVGGDTLEQITEAGLDRAEAAFLVAHQLDPLDARAIDGLGCVALRRQQYDVAIKHFQRALQLQPDYDRPFAHLALVAHARGHDAAAKALLERALRMNPLNYRTRNNYAVFLASPGGERYRAFRELHAAAASAGGRKTVVERNLVSLGNSRLTDAGQAAEAIRQDNSVPDQPGSGDSWAVMHSGK